MLALQAWNLVWGSGADHACVSSKGSIFSALGMLSSLVRQTRDVASLVQCFQFCHAQTRAWHRYAFVENDILTNRLYWSSKSLELSDPFQKRQPKCMKGPPCETQNTNGQCSYVLCCLKDATQSQTGYVTGSRSYKHWGAEVGLES